LSFDLLNGQGPVGQAQLTADQFQQFQAAQQQAHREGQFLPFPNQQTQFAGPFDPNLPLQVGQNQVPLSATEYQLPGIGFQGSPTFESSPARVGGSHFGRVSTSNDRNSSISKSGEFSGSDDDDSRPDDLSNHRQFKRTNRENFPILRQHNPRTMAGTRKKSTTQRASDDSQKENHNNSRSARASRRSGNGNGEEADEIAQLKAELAKAKKDMAKLQKTTSVTKVYKAEKCEELIPFLYQAFKKSCWRTVKFFQSEEQVDTFTEKLIPLVHEPATLDGYDDAKVASFCVTYRDNVSSIVSQLRAYVQQQMKNAALVLLENGGNLPSTDDILRCAVRDIDLTKQADLDLFEWYWVHILPKHGGMKSQWEDKHKYFGIPSEASYEYKGKEYKLFTPETEALFVTMYDNCADK